jgi:hypothetical protein
MTTALQCIPSLKPYTLAGFEPGIFCSVGGRDEISSKTFVNFFHLLWKNVKRTKSLLVSDNVVYMLRYNTGLNSVYLFFRIKIFAASQKHCHADNENMPSSIF